MLKDLLKVYKIFKRVVLQAPQVTLLRFAEMPIQ